MPTEMTRIEQMTDDERTLVNALTPAERKAALVSAAASSVRRLLAAHEAHQRDAARFDAEHPFNFYAMMDAPQPPAETPEAQAGALIAERGLVLALATQLRTLAEEASPTEDQRAVATHLIIAASAAL